MRRARAIGGAAFVLIAAAGLAAAPVGGRVRDTGVVNVSRTPMAAEGEESISVDPNRPRRILVGSNQWHPLPGLLDLLPVSPTDGIVDTALWLSRDGGRTWRPGKLPEGGLAGILAPIVPEQLGTLPGEFGDIGNVIEADQNTVVDRRGRIFFQDGDLYGLSNAGDSVIRVWRSGDGGRTFSDPVTAASQDESDLGGPPVHPFDHFDRPFLAVDNSGGPRDGTLYLTVETMFYQALLPQVLAGSSTDGGRTWSRSHRVDSGSQETQWDPRAYPEVGPDGTLYVVYNKARLVTPLPIDPELTPLSIVVARSTDGGRTFKRSIVEPRVQRVESPDEAFSFFTELISTMAVDPKHAGRLAVAWPNQTHDGSSRILMRYSNDGGRTWSRRIDVSKAPAGVEHDHATATYLRDGRLVVVWRDRRCCGGAFDDRYEVFARAFTPDRRGRIRPGREITLTSQPQPPTTGHHGNAPSEYIDATATPKSLLVTWDEPHGLYPENVFRSVPLRRFRR